MVLICLGFLKVDNFLVGTENNRRLKSVDWRRGRYVWKLLGYED